MAAIQERHSMPGTGHQWCCLVFLSKAPVTDLCCECQTPSWGHPANPWGVPSEHGLGGGHTAPTTETKEMGRGQASDCSWAVNVENVGVQVQGPLASWSSRGCSSPHLGCSHSPRSLLLSFPRFLVFYSLLGMVSPLPADSVGSQYPFDKVPFALVGDSLVPLLLTIHSDRCTQ